MTNLNILIVDGREYPEAEMIEAPERT